MGEEEKEEMQDVARRGDVGNREERSGDDNSLTELCSHLDGSSPNKKNGSQSSSAEYCDRKVGKEIHASLNSSFKFLGHNKYMEELVAMAFLENTDYWLGTQRKAKSNSSSSNTASNWFLSLDDEVQDLANRPKNDGENEFINMIPELNYFDASHFECSICMDPFYHPVALECRHKFCRPCITEMFRREYSDLTTGELCNIWTSSKKIKCPVCRASTTVVGQMPVLGVLCKHMFPSEYDDRKKQDEYDDVIKKIWENTEQPCYCTLS